MRFTIGMATYDDFDGCYFTVQALNMYHDMRDTEIVVVDNFGCDYTRDFLNNWVGNSKYIRYSGAVGTSAPRDLIFHEASGEVVVCMDCHVMFMPGAIAKLKRYYNTHPDCMDLIQGPMMNDNLAGINTHFDPVWRDHMWGVWGDDQRGHDQNGEPFEIPMQGLGMFCCRKDAWLGFNPAFRGFGGEEGYIHEKFRQAGRRAVCAPWLRWVHRFGRPFGVSYPLQVEDRIKNYLVGHDELHLDLRPIFDHFVAYIKKDKLISLGREALGDRDFDKYFG